jgi:radical SAM protein with 4Fe4S-binding SPASM domain
MEFWKEKVDIVEFQSFRNVGGALEVDEREFELLKHGCIEPFRRIMIWPEGDITLCCGYRSPDVTLGRILNNGIKSMWNGEKMLLIQKAFKKNRQLPTTCKNCINTNFLTKR